VRRARRPMHRGRPRGVAREQVRGRAVATCGPSRATQRLVSVKAGWIEAFDVSANIDRVVTTRDQRSSSTRIKFFIRNFPRARRIVAALKPEVT